MVAEVVKTFGTAHKAALEVVETFDAINYSVCEIIGKQWLQT